MTIEEVIEHCKRTTRYDEMFGHTDSKVYKEHKLVARWLEELKELKALLEKAEADVFEYIHKSEKAEQKGYNKALEDFSTELREISIKLDNNNERYFGVNLADLHAAINKIAKQLKEGGKNDN